MPDKYQNKYRIASHRMPNWDYANNGMYFITLVTQNRICNLGEIVFEPQGAKIELSDFGKIVNGEWLLSFEIREELFLDEYIIMPNHLHAIVILNNADYDESNRSNVSNIVNVETHGRASLQNPHKPPIQNHNNPPKENLNNSSNNQFNKEINDKINLIRKPKSISSFVAGFKSAVNSKIDDYIDEHQLIIPKYNRNNHFFQPNYHDHIIRDDGEYQRIKEYIVNNPLKWKDDKFFKE